MDGGLIAMGHPPPASGIKRLQRPQRAGGERRLERARVGDPRVGLQVQPVCIHITCTAHGIRGAPGQSHVFATVQSLPAECTYVEACPSYVARAV